MTDRIKGLTVALDKDYRDDDVKAIVDAIMMVKGVKNVTLGIVGLEDFTARSRAFNEVRDKIWEMFNTIKP